MGRRGYEARVNASFQLEHLVARLVHEYGKVGEKAWFASGDPSTCTVTALRESLARLVPKGMMTQGWMRSALFLRMIYLLKGDEGFETVRASIWAYTAALIDNLEKVCTDPKLLDHVAPEERYGAYRSMMKTLSRAIGFQMRLLAEVGEARAEYSRTEEALEYGRRLLRIVHFPDYGGEGFVALADGIAKFGPGGVPGLDEGRWKEAVRISKAILKFERGRKAEVRVNAT